MASISIRNVSKSFGATPVLQGLNIDIADGEFVSFLGPSGCGKSTLLFCIAGLEDITAGAIRLGAQELGRIEPRDRNIALVFQDYALYPHMRVRENIAFPLQQQGVSAETVRNQVAWAAELLGLESLLDRSPAELSGGQRQRVAVGRAIVRNPAALLMDEPLSNLDASLRVRMRTEIKRLQKDLGLTVIFVTHDQEEAMVMSDRIAVMNAGVLQQFAEPMTVYREPSNQFVASFIGSPQMNFLPSSMAGGGIGSSSVIGLRPHDLSPRRPGPDDLVIKGMLALVEPAGPVTFLDVALVDGSLVKATCPDPRTYQPGEELTLTIPRASVSVFDAASGIRTGALARPADKAPPEELSVSAKNGSAVVHGYDLILRGGHVLDPSQNVDKVTDVAFADGRVAEAGDSLPTNGAAMHDARGQIVTPDLIDPHTHVYWGGTSLGIDADKYGRRGGVTACVDTGSAGPGNFAGFRRHVIERSDVRVLACMHISFAGIYAFSKTIMVGESHDMRLMATREAVAVIEANRDLLIGVKAHPGRHASGDSGIAPLDVAMQAAKQTGVPLMAHINEPPPSHEAVMDRLRPSDTLTHCFRPFPNAQMRPDGTVRLAMLRARERGVLFDIGHGKGSFAYATARPMLATGFKPDTILSDMHILCIDGPAYDQVTTMSKFLCLGMELSDVIAASTINAAVAIGRPDLGSLRPGSAGDASLLRVADGCFDYEDVVGEVMTGHRRIVAEGVVLAGRMWRQTEGNQGDDR